MPLALDTVWIDADREKLVLVWRGLVAVATPKLPDIASVTLAVESLADPAGAIETLLEPNAPGTGGEPVDEGGAVPPPSEAPPPEAGPAVRTAALAAMINEATGQVAAVTEQLETAGVFERMQQLAARAPSPAEQRVQIEALARGQGPGSAAARDLELLDQVAAVQVAAEQVVSALEAEQTARKQAREAAVAARVLPRLPDGRVDVTDASSRGWRTLDLAGADLAGADLAGADLAGVDLGGANLGGATLTSANLAGARLVEASLAAANLSGASLVAADLGRADLSRADLSNADLSHADLTAARVSAVEWRGCRLTAAKLAGLDLYAADFTACVADHADFAGQPGRCGVPRHASGGGVVRRGERRADDVFRCRAPVGGVRRGARGQRVVHGVRSHEVPRGRGRLPQRDILGLPWSGGGVRGLRGSTVRWSRGATSSGRGSPRPRSPTRIDRCDLRHAVFEDAGLAGAKLTRNNLFEAVFDRADLTGASLAGSNAYGCGFWESTLDSLDIAGAIVAGTVLAGDHPT